MKLIYLLALVVITTVTNVVSGGAPQCSIWRLHARIPDETDCTRYYQCILTIPWLKTCPIIANIQTYFNPRLELCLWSPNPPCHNPTTTPGTSTSPVTVSTDRTDTTPGTSTPPVTFPTDKTDTTPGASTPPVTVPTDKTDTTPGTSTPLYTSTPSGTSTDGSTNTPTRPPDCSDNILCTSPIKGDCKHYYQWNGDQKIVMSCGKFFFYDSRVGFCNNVAYPPCTTTP